MSTPESRRFARANAGAHGGAVRCDACSYLHTTGDLVHVAHVGWCCEPCRTLRGGWTLAALLVWVQAVVDLEAVLADRGSASVRDAAVQRVLAAARDLHLLAARCGVELRTPWSSPTLAAAAAAAGFAPLVPA